MDSVLTPERLTARRLPKSGIIGQIERPDSWFDPEEGWWATIWRERDVVDSDPYSLSFSVFVANADRTRQRQVIATGYSVYCVDQDIVEVLAWARRVGFRELAEREAVRVNARIIRRALKVS